jgi:hypothetical protein
MADLTTKKRAALPKSDFGMPGERKYPMPDASHAKNAKARASQAVNAGRMSSGTEATIAAKANKVLGHAGRHGGALKPSPAGKMGHSKPATAAIESDRGSFRMK